MRADSVQLSRAHFAREFKKTFGQTPFAYVKARRVRHAQDIMVNTREPLSQIALACGTSAHGKFDIKLGKTADFARSAVGPLCAS